MRNFRSIRLCIVWLFLITFCCLEKGLGEPGEEKFNELQPPEQIMDAIGLKPGMVIADVGAGGGRFTVWFSQRVGETGRVIACDIAQHLLNYLKIRINKHKLKNIDVVLSKVDDPMLPDGIVDIIFMIDTYHHLENPVVLLRSCTHALKPDGVLVIIEAEKEKAPEMGWHATLQDSLIETLNRSSFKLAKIETFLPQGNLYVFKPQNGYPEIIND